MFGFHERRKLKRYFYSKVSLFILALLVLMLGWSVWDRYQKERETNQKRLELVAERDRLSARAAELGAEIERLQTDRGIEAELRNRFEVGAPGEKLVVIVDPELPEASRDIEPQLTFWGWLKSWFVQ